MTNITDAFTYHYSIDIPDKSFVPASTNGATQPVKIPISYYRDEAQSHRIPDLDCSESISGTYRKLIFNILSKVPESTTKKINFSAKYCYVMFDKARFLFCMDSVISKNTNITIPAQYLYYLDAVNSTSTVQEYLTNLSKVQQATEPDSPPLFREDNWPFAAGFIEDNFSIKRKSGGVVKFSGTGKLNRHPLGEFAGVVPIPKFEGPMDISTHGLVVGSLTAIGRRRRHTYYVQSALEELTSILWGDGGMTTWIMGQPGSGKEVFAQALHHGAGRVLAHDNEKLKVKDGNKGNFIKAVENMELQKGFSVQSVASVTLEEFNNRLFGVAKGDHGYCIVDVVDTLKGTIFLDEFDKPEKPFLLYSSLLRVLEAGQFLRRSYDEKDNSRKETPAKISKDLNWIFAGAFTQVDPRKNVPFDLWSRLKGFIQLHNPLEDNGDPDYGSALFLYWYFKLAAKILDEKSIKPLLTAVSKEPGGRNFREHVACILLGHAETKLTSPQAFLPSDDLQKLALKFQDLLNKKPTFSGDRLDSPRGIFKATEAAFYFLREKVFDGEGCPLTAPEILRDALAAAQKALRLSRGPA